MISLKRLFADLIGRDINQRDINQGIIIEEIRNETQVGLDDFIAEFVLSTPVDGLDVKGYGVKIVLGGHDYLVEEVISPTVIKVRFSRHPDFSVHVK